MIKKNGLVTIIRKSCITGKAVWVYRGPSENAARWAYWAACKREIERVRHWGETVKVRAANISRLLSECMADIPINAQLTDRQEAVARQLQAIGNDMQSCDMEFYNHIIEEGKRRNESSRRWREHRIKWLGARKHKNNCYDK